MSIASLVKRLARVTEDRLRYAAWVRRAVSRLSRCRAAFTLGSSTAQTLAALRQLCKAARMAEGDRSVAAIQERMRRRLSGLRPSEIDWADIDPEVHDPIIHKAAILKPWVSERERGVVFISFEKLWLRLFGGGGLRDIADRYLLVVAPSSSPHNLINYLFAAVYPGPIFTLIANAEDQVVLPRISEKFVVVPHYASEWVNPERFRPLPRQERTIDLLMVAGWGKVKRHFALFSALRHMPRNLRIVLIGQDNDGRTGQSIRAEAALYGVQDRFEVRENQRFVDVADAFCQARASIVLSRREGSCVVVTEAMFADTPVAILEDAHMGSRVFINEHTGRFLRERDLAGQLTEFIAESERYQPRQWAETNISCFRTSSRLNDIIKGHELARGRPWTRDLAAMEWCPDPRLVRAEDRHTMESERQHIRERYGFEIGRGLEAE